jgi:hypothetical protein
MSSSILKACDFCGLERAKAGAFAYGRGQRLEPSLTEEGKGWSLRLRKRAKAGAFAYATPSPGSAAKLLLLIRIDLGPQPDELDSHCNDLVCKQPLWICAETVTAAKALNGAFNFRQGTGDRRWNNIRVIHMFI